MNIYKTFIITSDNIASKLIYSYTPIHPITPTYTHQYAHQHTHTHKYISIDTVEIGRISLVIRTHNKAEVSICVVELFYL